MISVNLITCINKLGQNHIQIQVNLLSLTTQVPYRFTIKVQLHYDDFLYPFQIVIKIIPNHFNGLAATTSSNWLLCLCELVNISPIMWPFTVQVEKALHTLAVRSANFIIYTKGLPALRYDVGLKLMLTCAGLLNASVTYIELVSIYCSVPSWPEWLVPEIHFKGYC